METVWRFLKKLKAELQMDQPSHTYVYTAYIKEIKSVCQKDICTDCSFIHDCKDRESNSSNRKMDKKYIIYIKIYIFWICDMEAYMYVHIHVMEYYSDL